MTNLLGQKISSAHRHAIRTIYLLLAFGFVLMLTINLVAYYMFLNINQRYRRMDRSLINAKLAVVNANLRFREVIAGDEGKEMSGVWNLMKRAEDQSSILQEFPESGKFRKELEEYRQILLNTYTGIQEAKRLSKILAERQERGLDNKNIDDSVLGEIPDLEKLWEEYQSSYDGLLKSADQVDHAVAEQIRGKMAFVKLLYVALIMNILLLFGLVVYFIYTYVKKRRQTEELLTSSRDSLNAILDGLNAMVVIHRPDGTVLQVNRTAAKTFSWNSENVRGKKLWELLPPLEEYATELEKAFYSGTPREFYRERLHFGETERSFNIFSRPLPSLSASLLLMEDVTTQEIRDEHLRQVQQMRLLRNLVTSLGNDFNNVLGAIGGTLTLMRYSLSGESSIDENQLHENLLTMERSLERADNIVQQMLSLAEDYEITNRGMDLVEGMRHILNVVRNNLCQGVQVHAQIPREKAFVRGQIRLLEQVILNLVENAIIAMQAAGQCSSESPGTLNIEVEHLYPGEAFRARQPKATERAYWVIHIGDSGVGMDEATARRAFEPFFTTRDDSRFGGLGLAMVADLVEKLGGFIELRTKPNEGCVFSLYFPEQTETGLFMKRDEVSAAAAPKLAEGKIPRGTGTIMVVDDEEVMRRAAGNILKKLGYQVEFAADGEEAVANYEEHGENIDLILLDLAMPMMGGKETFLAMRDINPEVKVLLSSGAQYNAQIEEIIKLGVAGFIKKPYRLASLAVEVGRIMRGE